MMTDLKDINRTYLQLMSSNILHANIKYRTAIGSKEHKNKLGFHMMHEPF
jgi:hypothetical protein